MTRPGHERAPRGAPAGGFDALSAGDESTAGLRRLVDRAARREQLDPVLVHALIAVESAYDPRALYRYHFMKKESM
jgi:soluble lytic murein transglycosylase-like protein